MPKSRKRPDYAGTETPFRESLAATVNQRRAIDDLAFILSYVALLATSHDVQPAERGANKYAGLAPSGARPPGWQYPFSLGCP
jgi:hypothetical protein